MAEDQPRVAEDQPVPLAVGLSGLCSSVLHGCNHSVLFVLSV